MKSNLHCIEAQVRYLTTEEGGGLKPVFSGYRGQFHYDGEHDSPSDGFQYFPDYRDDEPVPLGATVRTRVAFRKERWDQYHSARMSVGTTFQIQEGRRIIGLGIVTNLDFKD